MSLVPPKPRGWRHHNHPRNSRGFLFLDYILFDYSSLLDGDPYKYAFISYKSLMISQ